MLNFNVPHVKNSTGEPVWKVRDFYFNGDSFSQPFLVVVEAISYNTKSNTF